MGRPKNNTQKPFANILETKKKHDKKHKRVLVIMGIVKELLNVCNDDKKAKDNFQTLFSLKYVMAVSKGYF